MQPKPQKAAQDFAPVVRRGRKEKLYYYNPDDNTTNRLHVVYHNDFKKSMEDSTKMQKMSLVEFGRFCDARHITTFIYDSENQEKSGVINTLGIKAAFPRMRIGSSLGTMYLMSNNNYIEFKMVRYVVVDKPSSLGIVTTLVCGDRLGGSESDVYTLVLQ